MVSSCSGEKREVPKFEYLQDERSILSKVKSISQNFVRAFFWYIYIYIYIYTHKYIINILYILYIYIFIVYIDIFDTTLNCHKNLSCKHLIIYKYTLLEF